MSFIRPLSTLGQQDVDAVGGKGASLGEMIQAGIPVPPGFVIVASAHEQGMTDDVAREILEAFKTLGARTVAVRSSATAEDGASASWAGELETYLNTTEETLLDRVNMCWDSLTSPRAVAYRQEHGQQEVAISVAVVVQKMVKADVAGVAFTVHPVTHSPNQIMIEACLGLGDKLVGGEVTPNSYLVDKATKEIIECVVMDDVVEQTLADDAVQELARWCERIEKHYGHPCDIEWAMEGGKLYFLQCRPITA